MQKQLKVNFGSWLNPEKVPDYYTPRDNETRTSLAFYHKDLVINKDGTVSSHYTWKRVNNRFNEARKQDWYIEPKDFVIVIDPKIIEIIGEEQAHQLVTFFFYRRWCGKHKKGANA